MKREKLLQRIMNCQKNVSFSDVVRLAEEFGFKLGRTNRSHNIFYHSNVPQPLNLQERDGKAKPYQVRQLIEFIEMYDLSMEKK